MVLCRIVKPQTSSAMYDKVKLRLTRTSSTPDIAPYLTFRSNFDSMDRRTGEVCPRGYLDALAVSVNAYDIVVEGSLPRYLNGNNFNPIDRKGAGLAIQKVSDELHCDFRGARVVGLEIGAHTPMMYNVTDYFPLLGDLPRMQRTQHGSTTLYYKAKDIALCFYDKIAEMLADGVEMDDAMKLQHWLRYELRISRDVAGVLGVEDATAAALSDSRFYNRAVDVWSDYYLKIPKTAGRKVVGIDKVQKPSDAATLFYGLAMRKAGIAVDDIAAYVDRLRAENPNLTANRMMLQRLKKHLTETLTQGGGEVEVDLLRDFTDFVRNTCAYTCGAGKFSTLHKTFVP